MTQFAYKMKKAIRDVIEAEELDAAERACAFLSKLAGREITLEYLPEVMQQLHPLIQVYIASSKLREHGLMLTLEEEYQASRSRGLK